MPYPGEHSARLEDPDEFDEDTFRRTNGGTIFGDIDVPESIGIIWAKYQERNDEDDPVYPQALRFDVDEWTEQEAKDWLDDNNIDYIQFEPAEDTDDEEENSAMGDSQRIELKSRAALQTGDLEVSREKGMIKNVSIITEGDALGHPFYIDNETLEQVAHSIRMQGGVKARLEGASSGVLEGHGAPGVRERLGKVTNPHVVDGKVKANLHVKDYAGQSPAGNLKEFIYALAEDEDARQDVGFSIVFVPGEHEERENESGVPIKPAARLAGEDAVLSADIVDDPGANPEGMLSRGNPFSQEQSNMDEELRQYLEDIGLDEDADEADAREFIEELEGTQARIAARLAEPAEPDDEDEDELSGDSEQDAEELAQEIQKQERERSKSIYGLAQQFGMGDDWAQKHLEKGTSVEKARKQVLDHLADKEEPLELGSRGKADPNIQVGKDRNRASLGDAISDAVMLRAGQPLIDYNARGRPKRDQRGELKTREPHDRAERFQALSMQEMARAYLRELGVEDAHMLSGPNVLDVALSPRKLRNQYGVTALAQSTSDFGSILGDTINKSLVASYEEAPRTWDRWAREATAPDYKQVTRAQLSGHPDLMETTENEEITYVTMSDRGETYTLVAYKAGIKLTREALINDDLDAFDRLPRQQAAAARRKEDDVCYSVLTANENMSDGNSLFGSNHSNNNSGGDVTTSNVATGREYMRTQEGPEGSELNITPAHLIVPAALEQVAKELVQSTVNPNNSNASANVFQDELQVVVESRLDADSTDNWYLAANYAQIDTVEVCFLEGERQPQTNQETDFDTGALKMKVRHTVASAPIDWRGLFRDDGSV